MNLFLTLNATPIDLNFVQNSNWWFWL